MTEKSESNGKDKVEENVEEPKPSNKTKVSNKNKLDTSINSEVLEKTLQKTVSSAIDIGYLKMSPMTNKNNLDKKMFEKSKTDKYKRPVSRNKSKSKNKKVPKAEPVVNHKLTDFYPIRRSSRKTKSTIKKEQADELADLIQSNCEHGLEIVEFTGKGRGIAASKNFMKGDFVVEYAGDLISWPEARQREQEYSQNSSIGCYMYYFNAKGKNYCIDATAESGKLGRLLNHSRRTPNCYTRLVWVHDNENPGKELPRLIIVAKQDVQVGEELTYDYGDRDKSALEVHPWLKS